MRRADLEKAAFIVDEDQAHGGRRTPSPDHEAYVLARGTGGKAPDEKTAVAIEHGGGHLGVAEHLRPRQLPPAQAAAIVTAT